jgi:hypothetical protein
VKLRYLAGALALSAAIATAACGDDPPPTQPTPPPTPPPAANPVLTAPTADSPADNEQLTTLRPTLVVRKASSDQTGPRTYEFQVSDDPDFAPASASSLGRFYRVVVTQSGIGEGPVDASFTVPNDLQPATRFYWRARARQGTTDGPFSATRTFRTRVTNYNLPGELYDPLVNGTTVGALVGNVTLSSRGATINTNDSHVRYNLARTITAGEFSFEADGIQNNSPGDKTKMMAMYDGNGDITTSDYRATIEKRDGGVVAWRFIAGRAESNAQIETTGTAERMAINFNPGATYFWRATWGGNRFNLEIFQNGIGGDRIYDFGKGHAGTYDPTPHVAYLGSPIGRAGMEDASVVGATWRNVYIADAGRRRPISLGTALIENPDDDPRIKHRGIRFVP